MENIELYGECGIYSENKSCDFTDISVKLIEVENWIDKPCPKCGHNLLTQEQFDEMLDASLNDEEMGNALEEALLEEGITDEMLKSIKIPQSDIDEAFQALEYLNKSK